MSSELTASSILHDVGMTAHVPFDLVNLINPDEKCDTTMAASLPIDL